MIATETIVPSTKLKIKLSAKRIEVDYSGQKCEFGPKVSQIDENWRSNTDGRSSVPDSNKRGPPASIEVQKEKRRKIDRKGSMQCATILKSLISHPYSWVFIKPVDPVALNIPDYFTIITRPMDLGTIQSKLKKNIYSGIEEFAADVRLTFSNAMTYNPPSNDVHLMAKELNTLFDRKWKDLEKKCKLEDEHCSTVKESERKSCNGIHTQHKDTLPKKSLVSEHHRIHKISLAARDAKVAVRKLSLITCKLVEKDLPKGSKGNHGREQTSGCEKACPPLCRVTSKCSVCGDVTCRCVIPSNSAQVSSDVSSDGSDGRDLVAHDADALTQDCTIKCTSPLQRKGDPDSDGTVSSLDSEHACPSSHIVTPATDAASGEVWSTPVLPAQLSPKKALRAAMLKSRFAETILKARQKTLLEHGDKVDPLKMQLEKERLERMQREERAKIEAQIKTVEAAARMRAEEELRQQREKEREAARVAIEKMKRTVEIEHNLEIIKELESISGCTLSYKALGGRNEYKVAMQTLDEPLFENPLERLGLFIKDDTADEDEEVLNGGWEEGEIL